MKLVITKNNREGLIEGLIVERNSSIGSFTLSHYENCLDHVDYYIGGTLIEDENGDTEFTQMMDRKVYGILNNL